MFIMRPLCSRWKARSLLCAYCARDKINDYRSGIKGGLFAHVGKRVCLCLRYVLADTHMCAYMIADTNMCAYMHTSAIVVYLPTSPCNKRPSERY